MERHERVLCGRELQKSIRDSSKRLLDDAIDRLGVRAAFQSTDNEIRGPNDSLFLFSGIKGNANGIKSIEGMTTFWGDEAQAFSQSSIDTVIPTIRKPNSRLIWTWNPDLRPIRWTTCSGAMRRAGWTVAKRMASRRRRTASFARSITTTIRGFRTCCASRWNMTAGRDVDKFNHIWRGSIGPIQRRGCSATGGWRRSTAILNAEYRQGADFGFSIDPSCLVRCYIKERVIYVDHEAWGLGVEIVNLPQLFMSIPDAEKWWTTADSSRPETISHLRNHGFPRIRSALKGARSVEEGVEFLKSYDIVVHPRCQHLIDELTLYSLQDRQPDGQVLPVLADKDNHMIDALRYAVEGVRRALAAKPKMTRDPPPAIPCSTAFNR
jgi:phage terminase large subunit